MATLRSIRDDTNWWKARAGSAWLAAATVLAFLPLTTLVWEAANHDLTANPIQYITLRTGKPAILLLMASLACTPAHIVFGFKHAVRLRRWLGLYAFAYALIHFAIFIFDSAIIQGEFDIVALREATLEKQFALAGFVALLILIPLALTSTKGWQRRLGMAWKRLHSLVYVAGVLACLHYVWMQKSDIRQPLLFTAVLAAFLLVRVHPVRRRIVEARAQLSSRRARKPAPQTSSAPPSAQRPPVAAPPPAELPRKQAR